MLFLILWMRSNTYVICMRQRVILLQGLPTDQDYMIMSPPMKWGDILFLAPLSVCPSRFRVRSISFEPLVGFTNNCKNVKSDETMCSAYVWPRSVQGQENIVWLYFVSALYLLNPWWDLQITLHTVIFFGLRFAFFTHISGKKPTVSK